MRALVNELKESGQFDLVLFDTPPVLGLAGAALVAEHCDGLMLLVSLVVLIAPSRRNPSLASAAVVLSRCRHRTNALQREKQSVLPYALRRVQIRLRLRGYGYGVYGYAAYNTSAAYTYYANDEDETQSVENGDSSTNMTTASAAACRPLMMAMGTLATKNRICEIVGESSVNV